MATTGKTESLQDILQRMTPAQRRMVAEGAAIMHRFKPEPSLKEGKPHYKGSTVEAIARAKRKS